MWEGVAKVVKERPNLSCWASSSCEVTSLSLLRKLNHSIPPSSVSAHHYVVICNCPLGEILPFIGTFLGSTALSKMHCHLRDISTFHPKL